MNFAFFRKHDFIIFCVSFLTYLYMPAKGRQSEMWLRNLVLSCNLAERYEFYSLLHPWKWTASSRITTIKKLVVGCNKDEGDIPKDKGERWWWKAQTCYVQRKGLLVPVGQQGCEGKSCSSSWEKWEEERETDILIVFSGSDFLWDCE